MLFSIRPKMKKCMRTYKQLNRAQRQASVESRTSTKNRRYPGDRADALGTINIGCVSYALNDLQSWGVCLIAQTGLQFDLATPQGKLIATMMAGLAEFERDLLRERVRSGVKAAQARGVVFGRRLGQRVKSDKLAPKVLALVAVRQSYCHQIGRQLDLSKNTVLEIIKRERANAVHD
jgi:DNA invertase Pin-like site-specific DNA recombinase